MSNKKQKVLESLMLSSKNIFDSTNLSYDLENKSVRSGVTMGISRGIMVLLNLVRTVILARLLTPADFGLLAMVTVFTGMADLFKDAGLSMATIQRKVITKGQITTLFWINITISLVIGCAIILIAPIISMFYAKPELTLVTSFLAISITIKGFSLQHAALLRRHFKYLSLGIIEIISTIIGFVVAIVLASKGGGYWSLLFSILSISVSTVIFTFIFCNWLPGMPSRNNGARSMLMFGINVSGFRFATYVTQNIDSMLIGKFIGDYSLGLYNRAFSVVQMPIMSIRKPIENVSISTFSRIQDDPIKIKLYVKKYVFLLSFLIMPLMVISYFQSENIILLILGSQWVEVTPIFKVFTIAGFIQLPLSICYTMLSTYGKSREYFYYGLFTTVSFVVAIPIGLMWGIMGVVTAYTVVTYFLVIPSLLYTAKHTPFNTALFFKSISKPMFASLISGGIIILAEISITAILWEFIANSMLYMVVYLIVFLALPKGYATFKSEVIGIFKRIFNL